MKKYNQQFAKRDGKKHVASHGTFTEIKCENTINILLALIRCKIIRFKNGVNCKGQGLKEIVLPIWGSYIHTEPSISLSRVNSPITLRTLIHNGVCQAF